jgi:hypothetical protein
LPARYTLRKLEHPATTCPEKAGKRRFLRNIHRWGGSIVKITALIVLLALAMTTGTAMIVSVQKEPVLLACGGVNC